MMEISAMTALLQFSHGDTSPKMMSAFISIGWKNHAIKMFVFRIFYSVTGR